MFLPLRYKLSENEAKEIDLKYGEDFCTIDDLYSVTHEISHLFDINVLYYLYLTFIFLNSFPEYLSLTFIKESFKERI